MPRNRQLVAIMFTDIQGYTSLMQQNEERALGIRNKHREIFKSVTEKYDGDIIQYYGDGTLSIFKSSIDAVRCAIEMQLAFQKDLPIVPVRIGIHSGDVIHTETDIVGDAVNITSRIESLAVSGSVLVSSKINDELRNQNDIETQYLDVFEFKNVQQSMPIFAISNKGLVIPERSQIDGKTKEKKSKPTKRTKRKTILVALSCVVAIAALLLYYSLNPNYLDYKDKSIAVLPFANMSSDADSGIFTDGVTEDILTHLSKMKDLQVISRSSVLQYKDSEKTIPNIAKELGVSYILDGSVRKYGDKIRINAQLIDAGNNNNIWAENYDKTLTEIFDVQSQVSTEIAKALEITLSTTERSSLNKIPTKSPEAYKIYQEAQIFLNRGGGKLDELNKAQELFKKAIALDPDFARAYVGLTDTYLEYIYWGRESPKEILDKALSAALKALELEPNDGGSYGALGSISFYRLERETAINYLEKALEINPNYVGAYDKLAWIRVFEGDIDEAVALFQKVFELDPLSPKYVGNIAFSHYFFRDYAKGIEVLDNGLKKFPGDNYLLWTKGNLLAAMGRYDEAIASFTARTDGTNNNWMLAYTYGLAGQKEQAESILNYQLEKNKSSFIPPYMIATIYMGLGDVDNTLKWLEKDAEVGGQGLLFWALKRDVKFDPIREEIRFNKILETIK